MNSLLASKAYATFLGLVIGDVLGAPVQFGVSSNAIRQNIERLKNYCDNSVLSKGVYTDDTSMALCLADSLIEKRGYDSYDIMEKFRNWENNGYRSYFDYGYDVGTQTDIAIREYEKNPIIPKEKERLFNAGNGSVMRLAPTVIAAASTQDLERTVKIAWLSGRETHYSEVAEMCTQVFANLLYRALHLNKDAKKSAVLDLDNLYFTEKKFEEAWLDNSWMVMPRANSDGECLRDLGGYAVDAITIAIWGVKNFDSFEEGMLEVLQLGGDTDTNCAIYGQLAGAYYGMEEIPERWQEDLAISKEAIFELVDELLKLPSCEVLKTRFEEDPEFSEPA